MGKFVMPKLKLNKPSTSETKIKKALTKIINCGSIVNGKIIRIGRIKRKGYKNNKERKGFWTITKKTTFGLVIIMLLISSISGLSIYNMKVIKDDSTRLYTYWGAKEKNVYQIYSLMNKVYSQDLEYYVIQDQSKREELIKEIDGNFSDLNNLIQDYYKKYAFNKEEENLLGSMELTWMNYKNTHAKLLDSAKNNQELTASSTAINATSLFEELNDEFNSIIDFNKKHAQNEIENVNNTYNISRNIFIGSFAFAIILCIVLSTMLNKILVKPIVRLSRHIKRIANGDFTEDFYAENRKDEIGTLFENYQQMSNNVKDIILNINKTTDIVKETSSELADFSQESLVETNKMSSDIHEINGGAIKQGTAIKESHLKMEKMTADILKISEDSTEVNKQMGTTNDKAKIGQKQLDEVVSNISFVADSVTSAKSAVNTLKVMIEQIDNISKVIQDIAGKTNLLALNARIEAARAGEHGKGFAVVAEEVRKLAENSSDSSQEINKLVKEIGKETDSFVSVMSNINQEVNVSKEIITTAGKHFEDILVSVKDISEKVNNFVISSNELSLTSKDVVKSLDDILEISEVAVGNTQEAAEVSKKQEKSILEVSNLSKNLIDVVQQLEDQAKFFIL